GRPGAELARGAPREQGGPARGVPPRAGHDRRDDVHHSADERGGRRARKRARAGVRAPATRALPIGDAGTDRGPRGGRARRTPGGDRAVPGTGALTGDGADGQREPGQASASTASSSTASLRAAAWNTSSR